MRHPGIAKALSWAQTEYDRLERIYENLEEGNPEKERIGKKMDDLFGEIRSLELAETDPEAHGWEWDSPSLPPRPPY
jgi:hypothetical protein